MKVIPYSKEAYDLFHEGMIALAKVEQAGMRINVEYVDRTFKRISRRMQRIEQKMKNSDVGKAWDKQYGFKTNYNSPDQLATILFDVMGYESQGETDSGRHKTDKNALVKLDCPFIDLLIELRKLDKAKGTYLTGIKRETVDGFLHPFFNLHIAKTFRSSSDKINFQNIPVRDPAIKEIVRKAFIPREGRQLVELDFSSLEVSISQAYHQDPTMFKYLTDPKSDMHRDMAMECFLLPEEEITPKIRYCGKNMFIFPQFYGDWYMNNAKHLWDAIDDMNLKTASGKSLQAHLKEKGIKSRGACIPGEDALPRTFERHIQEVEQDFWNERFPIYKQWKEDWYKKYRERGWLKMKTGFICQGYFKRNEAINYPVQGAAFHCLLWSLNQMVLREIETRGLTATIVGQIHDSIVADVDCDHLDAFLITIKEIMEVKLRETWDWINVPLSVDAEVAPPGKSWYEKKEIEF